MKCVHVNKTSTKANNKFVNFCHKTITAIVNSKWPDIKAEQTVLKLSYETWRVCISLWSTLDWQQKLSTQCNKAQVGCKDVNHMKGKF